MEDAERRLAQEITRLGHFAHVHDESIDAKRDVPPTKHGCMDVSVTCSPCVEIQVGGPDHTGLSPRSTRPHSEAVSVRVYGRCLRSAGSV
jgi:hypothetical protein